MISLRRWKRLFWGIGFSLLLLLLAGCGTIYNTNPLGYGFAVDQMSSPTPHIAVPTVTPVQLPDPLLKSGGLGNTLDTFLKEYQVLPISRPPTLYAFQASLDTWPGGNILFVSFENGVQDRTPRAVQFSLVPGVNHPTTYSQAQAFAQSLFPTDETGPVTAQALDTNKGKCLVMVWNSADIGKIFPVEDFLSGTSGKLGKRGDITVSFFPDVQYATNPPDTPSVDAGDDNTIINSNIIGSLLITLGDSPAC